MNPDLLNLMAMAWIAAKLGETFGKILNGIKDWNTVKNSQWDKQLQSDSLERNVQAGKMDYPAAIRKSVDEIAINLHRFLAAKKKDINRNKTKPK